ncbi:hypothetical protein DL770_001240 [Monosporascus sp. CRB-9-2]|nr:hypothetical protein DL770_001240 [Monosporascus sp. CRB-9-2]
MRPTLKVARPSSGPTSPPRTPTATSPTFNRITAVNGHSSPQIKKSRHQAHPPSIHPIGGTKFSYSPAPRPEEISPRSTDSSDDESEFEPKSDSGSESSINPPQQPLSSPPEVPKPVAQAASASIRIAEATFAIEEMSDLDPEDCDEDLDVLRPSGFEYPESDRSRSRSRHPPDMDSSVMENFKDFHPFHDSDDMSEDDGDHDDEEFHRNLLQKRQERRLRRMKSGSISKRTISERGSDSDKEDILPWHDGPETGLNARRLRRKTDRHSLQFSGQYPEAIQELKEPNSDDEIILEEPEVFARELPYWTLMDVDSE